VFGSGRSLRLSDCSLSVYLLQLRNSRGLQSSRRSGTANAKTLNSVARRHAATAHEAGRRAAGPRCARTVPSRSGRLSVQDPGQCSSSQVITVACARGIRPHRLRSNSHEVSAALRPAGTWVRLRDSHARPTSALQASAMPGAYLPSASQSARSRRPAARRSDPGRALTLCLVRPPGAGDRCAMPSGCWSLPPPCLIG